MKTFKLPKEFADKWLADLESGEFKQGMSYLLTDNCHYCCLGVALKGIGIEDNELYCIGEPLDVFFEENEACETDLIERLIPTYKKYPLAKGGELSDLENILMALNDSGYIRIHDKYPNLVFPNPDKVKIEEDKSKTLPQWHVERHTFIEIAQFIRDNVELIED